MSVRTFRFLNVDIQNVTFNDFLHSLEKGVVVTPNVDHLIKLQKDREFYACYQAADHIVCDSKILQKLSKFLDKDNPIVEQIAGSDLFPAFCNHHKQRAGQVRIFLLGGTEDSVQVARENINRRCGAELVVGAYSPPFGFEQDPAANEDILTRIQSSSANVLAVGLGAPKQELWITRYRPQLPDVDLFFAIGATIEFEAGGVQRAPGWMTRLGIEWLFRLVQEPRRLIKRYLVDDIAIFWLTLKQKLGWYKNPWAD